MDRPVWYNPKVDNAHENFAPYYNYHYNKSGVSYVDSFHYSPYGNAPSNISVLEIGAVPSSKEKEGNNKTSSKNVSPSKCHEVNKLKKSKAPKRKVNDGGCNDQKREECPTDPLKPAPCRGKIKHAECDKVSDETRALIYREFQSLSSSQSQWQFIASHVYVYAKIRSTSKGPSRRENTHQYFLTVDGEMVRICRKFFLSTLNVSEAMIRTALDKLSPQGICLEDTRGRKGPSNKLSVGDEDIVRKHILSFVPVELSHDNKKNAINYLDPTLSVATMHKMYLNSCHGLNKKPVSVETYRRMCKEHNIFFKKHNKDQNTKINPSHKSKKKEKKEFNLSKINIPSQNWQKEETRKEVNQCKSNEAVLHQNQVFPAPKPSQPDSVAYTSYMFNGVEAARDFSQNTNSGFSANDEVSSYEPSGSTQNLNLNFITDYSPSKTVIEIGSLTYTNEKGEEVVIPPVSKSFRRAYTKNESVKRNWTRLQRLRGESYVDAKGITRPARPMKPVPCRGQTKHSECDKISDENRALIYGEFRRLRSSQSQWQFIAAHVYVYAKCRSTSNGPSRRENTHQYFLTVGGEKVKVCRKFFLATLNVSEAMIRTALYKLSPQGICLDDFRGRKTPSNKLSKDDEEYLRKHILSYRSVDSTYYGKKNNKKYLDPSLSIAAMHKMYVSACKQQNRKPVSVETYRRICKDYNIAFVKHQKDNLKKGFPQNWDRDVGGLKGITITPLKENEIMTNREHEHLSKSNPDEPLILDFDLHTLLYMPEGS